MCYEQNNDVIYFYKEQENYYVFISFWDEEKKYRIEKNWLSERKMNHYVDISIKNEKTLEFVNKLSISRLFEYEKMK